MNVRIPRFFGLDFFFITGIANVRIPSSFRTLCDSEINSENGLKCWAYSNAIILSIEFSENGNNVEVELI